MPELSENSKPIDNESRWFSRAGTWFWLLIALGAALRIYFVVFTQGTYDAGLWQLHSTGASELGLLNYYRANPNANHPPLILALEAGVYRVAVASRIPFPVLFRAPFALLDAGTTLLLFGLLGANRWRFVLTAAYWINPLAILLSAYHGNTDSAVAFFLLLSIRFLSKEQIVASASALGAGLWIKLPGVLAVPALVLFLRGWRKRLLFLSIFGAVALLGYLPALISDAAVIATNVFGYHGRMLQTQGGIALWGPRVLFFSIIDPPDQWAVQLQAPVLFFLHHNWLIALLLAFLLALLRQRHTALPQLCATIAMVYVTVCGFTDNWALQYFAWSLPCWFFLPWWFFVPATLLTTAYVYSLNWTLCGNPWLLGNWDFAGHPYWPEAVIDFRNLDVLFFVLFACGFLIAAMLDWLPLCRKTSDLIATRPTG